MSFFNKIRSLFGMNTDVSDAPIDQIETIDIEQMRIQGEINKAQDEFNDIDQTLSLKIAACDKLIEKGVKEGVDNKRFLEGRLDRITTTHLELIKGLIDQSKKLENDKVEIESQLITKAVEVTAGLSDQNQRAIKIILDVWKETGIIKGEEVDSQARAITLAIEEIVKGGEKEKEDGIEINKKDFVKEHKKLVKVLKTKSHKDDKEEAADQQKELDKELKKSHESIAIEIAGKGDVEYDSPVEGHYSNVIVRRTFKEGEKELSKILFLKRASDKTIAPNKFCLPGGHIDEGETIETAAIRELKEESGLNCSYVYILGKAKCDNGKWAFYLEAPSVQGDVMLLDGESINAAWMCQEEWLEADLIFDLKDHLVAMESKTQSVDEIRDIMKGEIGALEKGGFGSGRYKIESSKDGKRHIISHKNATMKTVMSGKHEVYSYDSEKDRLHNSNGEVGGVEKHKILSESGLKNIEKAEGSRGGKVIGHTKSGKPVYADKNGWDYKGFSDQDHLDASDLHMGQRNIHARGLDGNKKNEATADRHYQVAFSHEGEVKDDEVVKGEDTVLVHENDTFTENEQKEDGLEKSFEIDNPFYYENEEELIKGKAAQDGEVRVWSGVKWEKNGKKWERLDVKKKSHSTKQLKEHVENTSSEQLKRVASNKEHPHNDAAKRELERRNPIEPKQKLQLKKRTR